MLNSLSRRYATPPFPDWLLTRMTSELAVDVFGIDRQVRHIPRTFRPLFAFGEAFSNRVLVRSTESREDQFARVRLTRRNVHAGTAFIDFADRVEIAEVQLRIDAMHVQVER